MKSKIKFGPYSLGTYNLEKIGTVKLMEYHPRLQCESTREETVWICHWAQDAPEKQESDKEKREDPGVG